MVSTILSMVLALVKLGSALLNWLHEKQLVDGAKAEVTAHNLQAQIHATRVAIQAREDQRAADAGADDDELRRRSETDPFRRD